MPVVKENYDVCIVGAGHAGCEAALTCHPAVWRYGLLIRFFPFTEQECFCYAAGYKIPWKDFVIASVSGRIESRIDPFLRKCFQPDIIFEIFAPGIKYTAFFVSTVNDTAKLSVATGKDAFQF